MIFNDLNLERKSVDKKRYLALAVLSVPSKFYLGFQSGQGRELEPELEQMLSETSIKRSSQIFAYAGLLTGATTSILLAKGRRPVQNGVMGAFGGAAAAGCLGSLVSEYISSTSHAVGYVAWRLVP